MGWAYLRHGVDRIIDWVVGGRAPLLMNTRPDTTKTEERRTKELEVGVEPLGDAHVHEADLLP